ncbi:hypothetical protein [Desulforegula conservatrix]|uniref:hypothetical protein n=1 Tax=Desulforegula conservatrix TaxID=153026 RepID=UPI00041E1FEB|nr:hypothetical protein [Desulforegula conservatrix]
MQNIHNSHEPPDFSLVLGGPVFQFLVRSRLATPALELMNRRIISVIMITWLPLLILSIFSARAWGGIGLPFFYDIETHARFLVSLPLLIVAELLVHKRMRMIVGQFIDREIITEEVMPKFRDIIASAMKLRNSVLIELIMFVLVFVAGHYIWATFSGITRIGDDAGSWYSTRVNGITQFSPAGYWYIFISRPMFQFILLRWYFRVFIWARFLWQSSRLDLDLIPTHPDRAAGIGFLGGSSSMFAPLLMAHGAGVAGLIANPIFFAGAKLPDFQLEILGVVLFLLMLVLGPLTFFAPALMSAKRTGMREYGILASKYVSDFDSKWVRGGASDDEALVGSGDIQSLADLGNSFQVIREIKPFPFSRETVVHLVFFTLLPGMPLILTMIPLEELITKLLGSVF